MHNMFRVVNQAVSELEDNIPDMVEAVETEKENEAISRILNRLAILINESRKAL